MNNKFRCYQKVSVISGFYGGEEGVIIGEINNQDAITDGYLVRLDRDDIVTVFNTIELKLISEDNPPWLTKEEMFGSDSAEKSAI